MAAESHIPLAEQRQTVVTIERNPTRAVTIGSITVGAGQPIAAQSMTATHTQDVAATLEQVNA
ncbi:MAG: hypothetical protein EBU59_09285, partial [Planctomycetia bacterium]|nr:hypothetical protein [Planctomycetia bacterium]